MHLKDLRAVSCSILATVYEVYCLYSFCDRFVYRTRVLKLTFSIIFYSAMMTLVLEFC